MVSDMSEVISLRIEKDVADKYKKLPSNLKPLLLEITRQFLSQIVSNIDKIMMSSINVNVELKVIAAEKVTDSETLKIYERKIDEMKKTIELMNHEIARLRAVETKYNNVKDIVKQYLNNSIDVNTLTYSLKDMFRW